MNATYNITDNRIKFTPPPDRFNAEQDAARKRAGFSWWPGRKLFAAVWSPTAEDFVASFGCEIVADDTPDDVEARVERFENYANDAENSAERAAEYAADPTRANTERRARLAQNRAAYEAERAEHWNRRITGAIRHAEYKERPDVIARRIKTIEADLRKHTKNRDARAKFLAYWMDNKLTPELAKKLCNYGSYWTERTSLWNMLDKGEITPEYAKEQAVKQDQDAIDHEERWIEHIEMRLQYERAYLDAQGGDPVAKVDGLKAGDKVIYRGEECEILKMNKTTVEIQVPSRTWMRGGMKVCKTDLKPCTTE